MYILCAKTEPRENQCGHIFLHDTPRTDFPRVEQVFLSDRTLYSRKYRPVDRISQKNVSPTHIFPVDRFQHRCLAVSYSYNYTLAETVVWLREIILDFFTPMLLVIAMQDYQKTSPGP